jgi:uncharacterized OsmC-like protein
MLRLLGAGSKAQRGALVGLQRMQHSGVDKLMTATAEAYAEGPTTLVRHGAFKFIVDEPPKLGGLGLGANPLTHFLGALAACTSYTLAMVTNEMKLPPVNRATWTAAGQYDLRGLQGKSESGTDARFRSIELSGVLDTGMSQEDLDKIRDHIERRCIIAATCAASGMDLKVELKRGAVAHDCQPACELHDLEKQQGVTGKAEGGKEAAQADAPRAAAAGGGGGVRGLHTAAALGMANGEDVAREHLGADKEPQIKKETSEQGAPETAGGAYASRDSPRAQAAPPTEGKSDEELVREQVAGAVIKPEESLHADDAVPPPPELAGEP